MGASLLDRLFRTRRGRSGAALRRLGDSCDLLLGERGAANTAKIATELLQRYADLDEPTRMEFFARLASRYAPDGARVLARAGEYAESRSAESLANLLKEVEPRRQELLRRLNRAPGGTAALARMRTDLLKSLKSQPALAAVDADFMHLFGSWFSPAFLQLVRVDWSSPARLLEQIIQHEAVHAIRDWSDLRRRLQPDRRCFAFLHPTLPGELLIFVEVALLDAMPDAIAPLLEGAAAESGPQRPRCAVFYSISNCQPGLRGVSLGNFLIKRVCDELQSELPSLRRFCTLSPMPGFAAWLRAGAPFEALRLPRGLLPQAEAARPVVHAALACGELAPEAERLAMQTPALRAALLSLGAAYLCATRDGDPASDPVAKFHLNNGARIERLNYLANRSRRGLGESLGMMVNYLYDPYRIEDYHEDFVHGRVAAARELGRSG